MTSVLERSNESQFVSFRLGTEEYGIDINNIQEIIKMPAVTRVPKAPGYVEGVVNLRGNILPIIDTRKRFDMDSYELKSSTRIVVTNLEDMTVGLIVDSVSEVMRIDTSRIEPPPHIIKNSNADYIGGIGKLNEGKRLISILNLEKVLEIDYLRQEMEKAIREKFGGRRGDGGDERKMTEELQMVSFQLDGEEYAVDIDLVEEIIRIPEITIIPDAPHYVEGVICLRGNVIPIINLRSRFSMSEKEKDDRSRILVVKIAGSSKTSLFGLVVDFVNEVISVSTENIESSPSVMRNGNRNNLKGIAKLDNGKRLVIIMDPRDMMGDGDEESLEEIATTDIKKSEQEMNMKEKAVLDEQQLVTLKLGDEEFGIDIMNVREIIRLKKITRVPGSPSYVRGVVNLRGNVLPIIDLRNRFELDSRDLADTDRIIVVTYDGRATGLIVDSVSEVLHIQQGQVEPPPEIVSGIRARFIRGIAKLNKGERFIIILNVGRILNENEEEEDLDEMEMSADMPGEIIMEEEPEMPDDMEETALEDDKPAKMKKTRKKK